MSVYCLQERLFTSAQERVHLQLVEYFVHLDAQRKIWYFTLTIRSHAQAERYTSAQARQLISHLMRLYNINKPNVEFALAFDPFIYPAKRVKPKIIKLKKSGISEENFKEQLLVLDNLSQEKNLEYRQALELLVTLLYHYPGLLKDI